MGIASNSCLPVLRCWRAVKTRQSLRWRFNARVFGVQFHPEVHHTLTEWSCCAGCNRGVWATPAWVPASIIQEATAKFRTGWNREVLSAISGGVDSSVATLSSPGVGDQLVAVFVDNGCCGEMSLAVIQAYEESWT